MWIVTKFELLSFEPSVILAALQIMAVEGVWDIRGAKPTGWGLYSIWLIEAGIVVLLGTMASGGNDDPFCEDCNEWTDEEENVATFPTTDLDSLRRDLEAEDYAVLDKLAEGTLAPDDFLLAKIFACSECTESTYLSIAHVTVTVDKDGDTKTNSDDVIKNLWIPHELIGTLKSYETEVASIEEDDADEDVVEVEEAPAEDVDGD